MVRTVSDLKLCHKMRHRNKFQNLLWFLHVIPVMFLLSCRNKCHYIRILDDNESLFKHCWPVHTSKPLTFEALTFQRPIITRKT